MLAGDKLLDVFDPGCMKNNSRCHCTETVDDDHPLDTFNEQSMKKHMEWHYIVINTCLYLTSVDEDVLEACPIFATLDADMFPSNNVSF